MVKINPGVDFYYPLTKIHSAFEWRSLTSGQKASWVREKKMKEAVNWRIKRVLTRGIVWHWQLGTPSLSYMRRSNTLM